MFCVMGTLAGRLENKVRECQCDFCVSIQTLLLWPVLYSEPKQMSY